MSLIRAELQHMAASDIEAMIEPSVLARVRQSDPQPLIKVFGVGHEGDTRPAKLVGKGSVVYRYLKDAIGNLYRRLTVGTPAFKRHGADNSHDGRVKVGELIGKTLVERDGKLNTAAAVHIYPQFRDESLDVASIEAFFSGERNGGTVRVEDFDNVTGIALGDSRETTPAFPGATLWGAMQNFATDLEGHSMTIEEIKAAMKSGELTLKPSDLFDEKDLKADPVVKDAIDKTGREAARRIKDGDVKDLQKALADEQKRTDTLQKERDDARKDALKGKRAPVFDGVAKERKFDENQRWFFEQELDSLELGDDVDSEEGMKTAINKFIDGRMDRYGEFQKRFNPNAKDGDGSNGTGDGGTPAGDGKGTPANTGEGDTNPVINPNY